MLTGLRVSDLATLRWSDVQDNHIKKVTSKGRGKRIAVLPLVPEAQTFLAGLKRQQVLSEAGLQPNLITKGNGQPMKPETVSAIVNGRAKELGIDRTAHNLRNTYATVLVKAGIPDEEIAGIMGWNIVQVRELIRIYVKPEAIAQAHIERLSKSG